MGYVFTCQDFYDIFEGFHCCSSCHYDFEEGIGWETEYENGEDKIISCCAVNYIMDKYGEEEVWKRLRLGLDCEN